MKPWKAFLAGLSAGSRYWQALLIIYAASLILVFPVFLLPALELAGPARSAAFQDAASGIPVWMISDWVSLPSGGQLPQTIQSALVVLIIAIVALPLLAWIPASLLSGGLLVIYAERPQAFSLRRFAQGCWRWLGAFLLLGLLEGILTPLIFGGILFLALVASSRGMVWLVWLLVAIALLAAGLWLALLEMTRVWAVAEDTRNIFRAFRRAALFTIRNPLSLAAYFALALALLLALHAIFRLGIFSALPLAVWPLVLIAEQAFIILRLWARTARYAGEMWMVKLSTLP